MEKDTKEEGEKTSKEEIKKENKLLKKTIFVLVSFIVIFVGIYLIIYNTNNFEIDGVEFEVVKVGELTLYKTSLPGVLGNNGSFMLGNYNSGKKADYNFYLRTDPRELSNVPLNEGFSQIKNNNVIDIQEGFNCNGDGIIAIANLADLYKVIGTNLVRDENATCNGEGRYGWIQIKEGEETGIERFENSCYTININNCDILKGTEKFMLETLIEVNKKLSE